MEIEELYRRYAKDVYRFAFYLSGERSDAEDIVSETFARVLLSSVPLQAATVRSYLFTIARNVFLKSTRRSSRHVTLSETLRDPGKSADDDTEHRDSIAVIEKKLAMLPDVDRTALRMRADGDSYDDIAAALGISVMSARVKVHRARKRLADFQ